MTNEEQIYLEEKRIEFEQILASQDWGQVESLYRDMEKDGYGKHVPEISELMSDEDVIAYKKWDLETNGSTETQML